MVPINPKFKRRIRRSFYRRRQGVEGIGEQADKTIDKLLLRRLSRLNKVRRFVAGWLAVFMVLFIAGILQTRALSGYFQRLTPASGGIYSEGITGLFTNANPIYANGAADTAVSQIIFPGLFKFDTHDRLIGDLATSWSLDKSQTVYTVKLRHGVTWQDGRPFTSADALFTYSTIQNPEAQSPLFSSWQAVKVSAPDAYTLKFTLPNPLSSFPYALTNGIIPKHLLASIPPAQLRSAAFNTDPIGTGPFKWQFITTTGSSDANRRQQITLSPFGQYWEGRPKLDALDLLIFSNDQQMVRAFEDKQINAMSGLDSIPSELNGDSSVKFTNIPLNALVMAFFNTSRGNLKDKTIRQALVKSVDKSQISGLFDFSPALASGPLLPSQISKIHGSHQPGYNLSAAKKLLANDGWKLNRSGALAKNHHELQLNLVSENTPQYVALGQFLQRQWAKLGVKTVVNNLQVDDLQGSAVPNHDYDILLYGITIGVDPDVFAYWDSSQASTDSQGHLNLSEYKSTGGDRDLEAARTRNNFSLRIPKYRDFLKIWDDDAPALALYQPSYLYVSRGPVYNFERTAMDAAADRFYNVANWEIRTRRTTIN